MTNNIKEYTQTQVNVLKKMKEYAQAYNVLEDAQIKFDKIKRELEELNVREFQEYFECRRKDASVKINLVEIP